MENLPVAIFSYKISDLLEEVTKRTSYIGKMRGNENIPHLLDVMSLTSGEDFLFNEFVEDAASETYNWLKAFGRKINNSFHAKTAPKEVTLWKNHGLYPTIKGKEINIEEEVEVESSYSLLKETTAIINVLETTNKVWLYDYLYKHLGENKASILIDSDFIYLDNASHKFSNSITIRAIYNGTIVEVDAIRHPSFDRQEEYAWFSESYNAVFYSRTPEPFSGSYVAFDGTDFENCVITDVKYILYKLPKVNMYNVSSYDVEELSIAIVDRNLLGTIQVSVDELILNTAISGSNLTLNVKVQYIIKTLLGGVVETSENIIFDDKTTVDNTKQARVLSYDISDFEWKEAGNNHELLDVIVKTTVYDVMPSLVGDIEAYTYVEYHDDYNNPTDFKVYEVNKDCTNLNWKAVSSGLPLDPRGKIAFILERTPVFDNNLIHSIDRNIKEAIVNFVIYRWFEYVNLQEADKFYIKFEDYAHKAQVGMNSETKVLQRKYKLF